MTRSMLALTLYADFSPRPGYKPTEDEARIRKVREGSMVWKNPRISLEEKRTPQIKRGDEVLIRVRAVGICGSDLHMVETDEDGYMIYPGLTKAPVVLGHEFSGVVEAVGPDVKNVKPGDPITSEEMLWCGICDACRAIDLNHCTRLNDPADVEFGEIGFTHDGADAEYIVVRERYLWKIDSVRERFRSDEKTFEAASLVEPTSVSYNAIFNRAGGLKPGEYVVVWGAGPIGLMAIALSKAAGAGLVLAFEVSQVRRELAKAMGADYVFDPVELSKKGVEPYEKILDVTSGLGADMHIEAAGAPHLIVPQMVKSLAIGGKIVQIGRAPKEVGMYLEVLQVRRAQVYGSQGHSGWGNFRNVIRLIAAGYIDPSRIITSRFRLDEALKAFEKGHKREDGKITIKP